MNFKFESIVQIFRKIIQLNAVIILKTTNEYYRKFFSKIGCKMDPYAAMNCVQSVIDNFRELFSVADPGSRGWVYSHGL